MKHCCAYTSGRRQEHQLRGTLADLQLQLEEVNFQVQESKEQDAAMDDLLKHKQELIQERDNQVPYHKLYYVLLLSSAAA